MSALRITGTLVTWHERSHGGERFSPGCFSQAVLAEFFQRGAPLVWDDDARQRIGTVTRLVPGAVGMLLEAVVDTDDADRREAIACRLRNCLSWVGESAHWPIVDVLTCVSVVQRGAHPSAVILTVERLQEAIVCTPSLR